EVVDVPADRLRAGAVPLAEQDERLERHPLVDQPFRVRRVRPAEHLDPYAGAVQRDEGAGLGAISSLRDDEDGRAAQRGAPRLCGVCGGPRRPEIRGETRAETCWGTLRDELSLIESMAPKTADAAAS